MDLEAFRDVDFWQVTLAELGLEDSHKASEP